MSHTPGPWYDDGYRIHAPSPTTDLRDGAVIVEYKYLDDVNPDDYRLIAAAPNLLAALKAIMRHVESEFRLTGDRWVTSIRADAEAAEAAIAKAEPPDPAWDGADRRSGNGIEHAARDERRGPEGKR